MSTHQPRDACYRQRVKGELEVSRNNAKREEMKSDVGERRRTEEGVEVRCGPEVCRVSLACGISEPAATHSTLHYDLQLSNHPAAPSQANFLARSSSFFHFNLFVINPLSHLPG